MRSWILDGMGKVEGSAAAHFRAWSTVTFLRACQGFGPHDWVQLWIREGQNGHDQQVIAIHECSFPLTWYQILLQQQRWGQQKLGSACAFLSQACL